VVIRGAVKPVPGLIEVVTKEDLLDKLVYIATNPVKDGLVDTAAHWPGPRSKPVPGLNNRPQRVRRPDTPHGS
jgi:hypothetical protein